MAVPSVTLESAKKQCRVRSDETEHDTQISTLIAAAQAWAVQYCNLEDFDDFDVENSPPSELPDDVAQALRLHVQAHFDTDPDQYGKLIATAQDMLWPHRVGLGV